MERLKTFEHLRVDRWGAGQRKEETFYIELILFC